MEDKLGIEGSALPVDHAIDDSNSDSEGESTPPGSTNTRITASDQDYKFNEDPSSTSSDNEDKEQTDLGSGSTI